MNKNKIKWNRKKKAGAAVMAMLTGCLCFTALADGPSTNVWLDVVEMPTEARISVTVPLSYGFVVVGSVQPGDTGPVSVEDGNLLLSNVRVEVENHGTNDGNYSIQVVGEPLLPVRNYSTDVREENLELESPPREGLPITLEPYLVSVPESAYVWQGTPVEHHWKPSAVSLDDNTANFKKFRMGLDGVWFSKEVAIGGDDVIQIEQGLELDGPPDVPTNGYTVAGTANIPSVRYLPVEVEVGGQQNQYKQVEQSLKVGAIKWVIIPGELPEISP